MKIASMTMEMEAVTMPFYWLAKRKDSQKPFAVFLADSVSLLQEIEERKRPFRMDTGHATNQTGRNEMDILSQTCRTQRQ